MRQRQSYTLLQPGRYLSFLPAILVLVIRCRMLAVLLCVGQAAAFGLQRNGSLDAKDCTVGNPQPLIAKRKDVTVIRKGSFELVEQLHLSPQIKAEITQAGCIHYGLKMAFTTPVPRSGEKNIRIDTQALRLLRALKPRMRLPGPLDEAIAILTRHKNDPVEEGQPLQDSEFEMVTLYLNSETKGTTRLLVVTYSSTL